MVGHLLALDVEKRQGGFGSAAIDFDELFPLYVAAVRAGDDPAKGLGDQGFDYFEQRRKQKRP